MRSATYWIATYAVFVIWGLFIVIKQIRIGNDFVSAVMLGFMVAVPLLYLSAKR